MTLEGLTMNSEVKTKMVSLYDIDFQCWLDQTVAQLRAHDFNNLDLENLIEEIESLGRSEKHTISSYLMRLCEHLLKIKYWESEREMCLRGWKREVINFRLQIQEALETSPSLKSFLQDVFVKQYKNGRKLFLNASELDARLIPEEPDFTLEQALDEDWLPWQPK
jgi:CRISPR/Cas system CMR-associated protein Cmr5 small subunit